MKAWTWKEIAGLLKTPKKAQKFYDTYGWIGLVALRLAGSNPRWGQPPSSLLCDGIVNLPYGGMCGESKNQCPLYMTLLCGFRESFLPRLTEVYSELYKTTEFKAVK